MRIPDLYAQARLVVSFEFYPPKTDEAEQVLFRDTVPALKRLGPAYISVTYGAGGSTRAQSFRIVQRLRREYGIEAMAHLTCVGATPESIAPLLDEAQALGIENLLALRGDAPRGETGFKSVPGGFAYATELVQFIKQRTSYFAVGGACYPEGHVECRDKYLDWDRTVAKVEAGAEFLITQLFYNIEDFLELEDYLRNRRGLTVPLIPGILPFLNAAQIKRFTSLCGAKLSDGLRQQLEAYAGDDESVRRLGVEVCTDLCQRLLAHGVPGLHLYCLNKATSCAEIVNNLGLAGRANGQSNIASTHGPHLQLANVHRPLEQERRRKNTAFPPI